jgi:uncharacterized membrane protein
VDWLSQWGAAMGAAWLAGINLYATALTLGLLQHFGFAKLPGDLGMLGEWWVIGLAAVLYFVEFVADKIPAVDSIWDAIHTFIRIPAGAIMAAAAFAHFDPSVRLAAFLIGGGVAFSSHGAKAATRLTANASPEPFSNIALSITEDAIAAAGSFLAAFHPAVLLGVVAIGVLMSFFVVRTIVRAVRRLFRAGKQPAIATNPPTP